MITVLATGVSSMKNLIRRIWNTKDNHLIWSVFDSKTGSPVALFIRPDRLSSGKISRRSLGRIFSYDCLTYKNEIDQAINNDYDSIVDKLVDIVSFIPLSYTSEQNNDVQDVIAKLNIVLEDLKKMSDQSKSNTEHNHTLFLTVDHFKNNTIREVYIIVALKTLIDYVYATKLSIVFKLSVSFNHTLASLNYPTLSALKAWDYIHLVERMITRPKGRELLLSLLTNSKIPFYFNEESLHSFSKELEYFRSIKLTYKS